MKSRLMAFTVFAALALTGHHAWADVKPGTWAELKAYHAVMSATLHPAEEGNLEPVKTRSGELASAAKTWAAGAPPAEFN